MKVRATKKTGAWLARYALEQVGVKYTFGIPGVHNTELYDELNSSTQISPTLVTHEGHGAFMADAVSRTSDSIGTLVIVPAAGVTHAASGIGEAFLDGIPMLIVSGGIRNDSDYGFQLHEMDQHKMLEPITKAQFKIESHDQIIDTIYQAYHIAVSGEPGPVFVEIPVNLQIDKAEVGEIVAYDPRHYDQKLAVNQPNPELAQLIKQATELLIRAKKPGIFLGWGAVDALQYSEPLAELLAAPVATTLQGLSSFNANHPLHTGFGIGPGAVPASENAFKGCDCLIAVGTRFGEIATASYGIEVPENLIHIDINSKVFNVNFPAKVAIEADASTALEQLLKQLQQSGAQADVIPKKVAKLQHGIAKDKMAYQKQWQAHDSQLRVNPALFFNALRPLLNADDFVVADDGNHTFLTAELMPIYQPRHFISPTDFNCMGYAAPAAIATKMANPENKVVAIIGDGAFMMTAMELITAKANNLGVIFFIFNDGELSQISQAQQIPYNRKPCTVLPNVQFAGIAQATGCEYLPMNTNQEIEPVLAAAFEKMAQGCPVIVDVNIDYSKQTSFTGGAVKTNLKRMPLQTKVRMISRAVYRKLTD